MIKKFSLALPAIILSTLIVVVFVLAWQEPISSPPSGNVPPPLNTSDIAQTKTGTLRLGGLRTDSHTWLATESGNVGIGTTTPSSKLTVVGDFETSGNIKVKDSSNVLDTLFSGGIIKEKFLPYCKQEITSDVYTNGQSQSTGCSFGGYTGYYDISNLTPANVKKGVSFGRGQVGTLEQAPETCPTCQYWNGEACVPSPSGTRCWTGSWSSCSGFGSICDETGTQSRQYKTCSNGVCGDTIYTETQSCVRDTDGNCCYTYKTCVDGACTGSDIESFYTRDGPTSGNAECSAKGYECNTAEVWVTCYENPGCWGGTPGTAKSIDIECSTTAQLECLSGCVPCLDKYGEHYNASCDPYLKVGCHKCTKRGTECFAATPGVSCNTICSNNDCRTCIKRTNQCPYIEGPRFEANCIVTWGSPWNYCECGECPTSY